MSVLQSFVVVILLQNLIFSQTYEYCTSEAELCRSKTRRHIVCYKEQIKPRSKYEQHYPMTDLFRKWILYWHNYYRNDVACGKVPGKDGNLPSSPHMRELAWDYELEYLASIHAGRCNMEHDDCRNTARFPYSGQNLAYRRTTGPPHTPLTRAMNSIRVWFMESENVTAPVIDKYEKTADVKIGHFTVLANDLVGRVGCSMTLCMSFPGQDSDIYSYQYFTCNYDYTNVLTYPVYKIGNAASNCKKFDVGKSSNFSCLCASPFSIL